MRTATHVKRKPRLNSRMPHNARNGSMNSNNAYDYIVVGGGSAGCVVAGRLAEANVGSVLLIETGDLAENNPETLSAEGFTQAFANDKVMLDRMSTPQASCAGRTLYMGSGSVMGGSGAVNGMVYTRGDKLDFEQWPAGWQWDDNAPAFAGVEQRLRVRHRAPGRFTEIALDAAERNGLARKHGLNDGELCGFMGYNDMNYEGDARRNSYVAFIKENSHRQRLTIKSRSLVHRILFDAQHNAVAVECESNGVRETIRLNRELVLCAGALETPKLLMLSGVGPAAELQPLGIPLVKDVPGIGQNLHDHPNVSMFFQGKQPPDFAHPQVYGFQRCNPDLPLPPQQADTCLALLAPAATMKRSMYRMLPATVLPPTLFFNKPLRWLMRRLVDAAFAIPATRRLVNSLFGIVVILGKPKSRGRLRLRSSNVRDPAVIDPAYYQDPADMDTLLNGIALARQIAADHGLREWGSKSPIPALQSSNRDTHRKWAYGATMTTFHYCGTCSMGEGDAFPVDASLRLKGFGQLRIADASVIPEIPVSALNAPSMMIGYRAADFILQQPQETRS